MRINKIEVKNLKAIHEENIDLYGCSAIITAGNDKGKTSLLKGLIDRFHGEKPELIVRKGEDKGYYAIELTDESKIEWRFTEKTETFSFTTKEGIKQTTGVLKAIGKRYFGIKFDIDNFLSSSRKEQSKTVSQLVGLDFEGIDARYQIAYNKRTDANRELKRLESNKVQEPEKVDKPDVEKFKSDLSFLKDKNLELKNKWVIDNEKHLKDIQKFNDNQKDKIQKIQDSKSLLTEVNDLVSGTEYESCFDKKTAKELYENLPKAEQLKSLSNLPEPEYHDTEELETKIEESNDQLRDYDSYRRDLNDYQDWKKELKEAKDNVDQCEKDLKEVEQEKMNMIKGAKLPEEFEFTEDGVLFNGLPLDNNQISSSGKYIAALKLGSMVLGEIRTMHFDASFLDKNSLSEIEVWAKKNDMQLLIEKPDWDSGDIQYEIIKND